MMKKIIFLIFLLIFLAIPSSAIAAQAGALCASPGANQNCTHPQVNATGCCTCATNTADGKSYWLPISLQPCDQSQPISGGQTDICNPVLGLFGCGSGADIFARIVANLLKIAYSVTGLVLLVMLIVSGISWMTTGGDKDTLAKAQKTLTSALVGFAVFVSVFAIINFIAPALGLTFLQVLKIQWPTP